MKVLISGGGTGGHIFPALSIADAIKRRDPDADILFVGAENRMEMERVPAAGYEIIGLPVSGFDRKRLWRNIAVLFKLWKSIRIARRVVREFQPDIAIGVGGYASGPTLKAAQRAGVPTLLQEQNSYAGVTNKLLAPHAAAICVAYPGMERFFPADKIVMTGNPVRKSLFDCKLTQAEAKESLGFEADKPLVVFVGGSLGARTLNQTVIDAMADGRAALAPFNVLWQTGKRDHVRCVEEADKYALPNIKCTEFISDMAEAYRAADLVVARAGAGTISELELLGKPSILVPSPNVAEDHQTKNARALSDRDAAVFIADADARDKLVTGIIDLLADKDRQAVMTRNIKKLALPDSDNRIVDEVIRILNDNSTNYTKE